nr:MAG TPA: hypothetical protein [Caudoviricetes sp.]
MSSINLTYRMSKLFPFLFHFQYIRLIFYA